MMNIEKIKPTGLFTNYIYKAIPLAFDESMSYYETLCGLLSYLKDTVIPALNNNADAIIEVQNLMTQLQNYVDNYFENLDVQEEINNKLDEMAESGELTDIIAQYLQLAGILAFNTVNDLKNAQNITNGSICKTLGYETYNDGKGEFYKIRTITSSDVVDNINIIALQISNTLIAEIIVNINNSKYTIMIGDSYGVGTTSGGTLVGWCDRVKNLQNIPDYKYHKFVEGGSGFCENGTEGHTFLTLLQSNINTITNKNLIEQIIVCGGFNDQNYSSSQINLNIESFVNYCKQQFPNAKVYIGMIGNTSAISQTGTTTRNNLNNYVIRGYQNCVVYGAYYLNGIENIMKDYEFMSEDEIHPNEFGYTWLSAYINNAIITGKADFIGETQPSTYEFNDVSSHTMNLETKIVNDIVTLSLNDCNITFTTPKTIRDCITIGKIKPHYIRTHKIISFPIKYYMTTTNNEFYGGDGTLLIDESNNLVLFTSILKNDGNAYLEVQNVSSLNLYKFEGIISSTNA